MIAAACHIDERAGAYMQIHRADEQETIKWPNTECTHTPT